MNLLKKIIDLVLYGNFWIALGGLTLTLQTQLILSGNFQFDDLSWFVFFSTFLLYALHRIVGILRLNSFLKIERYSIISTFRHHIIIYAVFASTGVVYFFFKLTWQVQLALIIPAIISLGYVLPFFGNEKRLRDFDQIKIYLIAGVWAFVTVILPAIDHGGTINIPVILMIVERGIFVFAITLPFDIRDLIVDNHGDVKTIPGVIGIKKTKQLGYLTMALAMLLALIIYSLDLYDLNILIGLGISYLSSAVLISYSSSERHDYFYSGLMDGTMILQFLIIWGICTFF